jgi:hypothetical protein
VGDGKIRLFWDPNSELDLEGYFIYRSRSPEGPFGYRVNATPVLATEFLDGGVDNSVTYTYAIRAVDQHGNESGFSNKIARTPQAGIGDPPTEPDDGNPGSSPCAGTPPADASTVSGHQASPRENLDNVLVGLVLVLTGAVFFSRVLRGNRKKG